MGERTVKFRPDQPLVKADAIHLPLWIHAPGELIRGLWKWLTVTLARDNPHRNAMVNPTMFKPAKTPHKMGYWSGKPVVKGPKWKVAIRRWGSIFTILALIKYLPVAVWLAVAKAIGYVLVWVGLTLIPFLWAHWWMIPVALAGIVSAVVLTVWLVRRIVVTLHERNARNDESGVRWYTYVLVLRDRFVRWVKG